ncbi:hypothetical protein Tco_0090852 [Tanacetum coccineum]
MLVFNWPPFTHLPVDQDIPSPSNSHTTQETQTPIISHDVEEDNHDIEVAHMGNDPYFGIPIPEVTSDQSSSSDVIHTIRHKNYKDAITQDVGLSYAEELSCILNVLKFRNLFSSDNAFVITLNYVKSGELVFDSPWSGCKIRGYMNFSSVCCSYEHGRLSNGCEDCVSEFNTTAGNPVKKILLKLNLSDHRLFKDGGGVTSIEEPVANEPTTLVSNDNADESVQEDVAVFDRNVFYNLFHTLVFKEAESSSTFQDPSNMYESRLHTNVEMCMYALTVSTTELTNIKEAMLDHSWIESMQDELNQFKRLDVWELVARLAHPTEKQRKEVKRIFRYLKHSINMGLWCSKDSGFELIAYSDADHAWCHDDCKSTSGGIQFLVDKLVSWSSKKHDCTTMSTAKAEYIPLYACCIQVIWMRTKLLDYGYRYTKIPMYCNSKSAIAISCNPVQHSRTKHINIRYHFIKEHVEQGTIELYFIGTEYQLADVFTKALPKERFEYLVNRIVDDILDDLLKREWEKQQCVKDNKRKVIEMNILDVLEQGIEKVIIIELDTNYDHKPFQVSYTESSDHNPFQATSDESSDHNTFQATYDESSDHNPFQATFDESSNHNPFQATSNESSDHNPFQVSTDDTLKSSSEFYLGIKKLLKVIQGLDLPKRKKTF